MIAWDGERSLVRLRMSSVEQGRFGLAWGAVIEEKKRASDRVVCLADTQLQAADKKVMEVEEERRAEEHTKAI